MIPNLSPGGPREGLGALWLSRFQSSRLGKAAFAVAAPMLTLVTTYLLFFD
jgi:hypothetical protein